MDGELVSIEAEPTAGIGVGGGSAHDATAHEADRHQVRAHEADVHGPAPRGVVDADRTPAGSRSEDPSGDDAEAPTHPDSSEPDSPGDGAPGYSEHRAAHLRRLRRIEGQTRGLQRMIENDEYCIDVLTQVSATMSALRSLALSMLDEHLAHCVAHAIQSGGQEADDKLAEANAAIARLVRS